MTFDTWTFELFVFKTYVTMESNLRKHGYKNIEEHDVGKYQVDPHQYQSDYPPVLLGAPWEGAAVIHRLIERTVRRFRCQR